MKLHNAFSNSMSRHLHGIIARLLVLSLPILCQSAPAAPFAYAATGVDTLSVIDTASDGVVREIAVPGIGTAYESKDIAVHPQGHTVYATTGAGVSFIDAATGSVVAVVTLDTRVHALAVHPDGTRLYVATEDNSVEGPKTLYVLDIASRAVTAEIPLEGVFYYGVRSMAVSPDGSRLYLGGNDAGGKVAALNTQSLAVVAQGYACDWTVPDLKVSPDGVLVFAVSFCEWSSAVWIFDAASLARVGDYLYLPGLLPIRLAVHPTESRFYVLSEGDGAQGGVSVVDTTTRTLLAEVPLERRPWDIAIHPDGLSLYATSESGVSVIDTVTNAVRVTLPFDMPYGTGTLAMGPLPTTVGGTATGLDTGKAACRNASSGDAANIPLRGVHGWDCQAAGLKVSPDDAVFMTVLGRVDGNAATIVGGSATGFGTVRDITCNNTSTAQNVMIVGDYKTWNCEAAGLAVNPQDQIMMRVRGRAQ